MGLFKGQSLQNRYQILAMLGQGGMGAVYRAWDARLKIPVALKELQPQPDLDRQALERLRQQFEQEATVLARLKHPHLVGVTDFFREGQNDYLVMEFVQGESLAARIGREGPLAEKYVLYWAHQLLQALAYCHREGVIHRDVKPHNVIIDRDGSAVLVDFGLVKLWDPRDPRTRTVMRGIGTPEYAPPEQYDVAAGHTDARSDVYSLGATLYHALSGHSPPTATQRTAGRGVLRPLRELAPGVSLATEAVVQRAMALVAEDRYSSAREMAAALGARPRAAPDASVVSQSRIRQPGRTRPKRPDWWVWGLVGLAGLLLCTIATAGSVAVYSRLQAGRGTGTQGVATVAARAAATATADAEASAAATIAAGSNRTTATHDALTSATAQAAAATATMQAGATATVMARLEESARAASHWPLVLADTFDSNANGWPTGSDSFQRGTTTKSFSNGKYRYSGTATSDSAVLGSAPITDPLGDFYATIEARRISGTESSFFGLMFQYDQHATDGGFFLISDTGDFAVLAIEGGQSAIMVSRRKAPAIRPGEVNRLTVISEGSHYIFLVNDQIVGETDYTELAGGMVGTAIQFNEAGYSGVFEFDNFELRAP